MVEQGEDRRRQLDDPGDGAEQAEPHDEGKADADLAGLSLCPSGSLLVRMEMNTRLSMPSTTSMAISVMSAIQAAGSASKAVMSCIQSCPPRQRCGPQIGALPRRNKGRVRQSGRFQVSADVPRSAAVLRP